MKTVRYVIVSPVRDEADHIRKTLDSVLQQTIPPAEMVVVNDGSTDQTGAILDEYASRYPWIRVVHRANRGFRKSGGGVMDAFYEGYSKLQSSDWDYIVKLDGDLSFEPDYFEQCFYRFDERPDLGIAGGGIYHVIGGELTIEKTPTFHVRGATKIYRRKCWDDIGGLIKAPGWDTLDEVKGNMKGWKTQSFNELVVRHYRFTGAADGSWKNCVKNGTGSYICGYHPLFMTAKILKRLFCQPIFIGSMGLLFGYIKAYITNVKQVDDKELIKYIRKEQLKKITLRDSIWN